jgi:hypothetical protein
MKLLIFSVRLINVVSDVKSNETVILSNDNGSWRVIALLTTFYVFSFPLPVFSSGTELLFFLQGKVLKARGYDVVHLLCYVPLSCRVFIGLVNVNLVCA